MQLIFNLPGGYTREHARAMFTALAEHLREAPITLSQSTYEKLPDQSYPESAYRARWEADGVVLDEEFVCGEGNPREGYGYHCTVKLTVQRHVDGDAPVVLTATDSSYEPRLTRLSLLCAGLGGAELAALRGVLRERLGAEHDRGAEPWSARYTVQRLDAAGERDYAVALAREAVESSPVGAPGRGELLEWMASAAPHVDDLGRRLREAPGSVLSWRQALSDPPEGFAIPVVRGNLARLCPFDSELAGGPWFAHPFWPVAVPRDVAPGVWRTVRLPANYVSGSLVSDLSSAVTGLQLYRDWHLMTGESLPGRDGWRCHVSRAATYVDGVLHANVTLEAGRDDGERVQWTWLAGRADGDFLLIARRLSTERCPAGALAWCVVGTASFQDAVERALEATIPYRFCEVPVADSLVPRVLAELPWWDGALPAVRLAQAVLEAAPLSPPVRARALELLKCRCPRADRGYCEHRVELLQMSRVDRFKSTAGNARSRALEAALQAAGRPPDSKMTRHYARQAHDLCVVVGELRDAPEIAGP